MCASVLLRATKDYNTLALTLKTHLHPYTLAHLHACTLAHLHTFCRPIGWKVRREQLSEWCIWRSFACSKDEVCERQLDPWRKSTEGKQRRTVRMWIDCAVGVHGHFVVNHFCMSEDGEHVPDRRRS